jgi:VWFA-related protein
MIYALKADQFVVEDNGVPQTIHLDEDTDALGLTMVVLVQCSRAAVMQQTRTTGLATMIDSIAGGAPRQIAIASYGTDPTLIGDFTSNPETTADSLAQLSPCDDDNAATYDAVGWATSILEARNDHNRHVILLVSETRDHGSKIKAAEVIAALGRTNTVVDAVSFNPGKTEVVDELAYKPGPGVMGLLLAAINALKKNASHTLASMSGGEYTNFTTRKGFDAGLMRLTNHVHNYYLLSFTPKPGPDGNPSPGMHALKVKVPDYPDAHVKFRESYFAGSLDSLPGANDLPVSDSQ